MEQYADVIIDPQGNVVVGAMVSILDSQGAPAQIFGSNNQNSSINNPLLTGALGEFSFFARNGRYRIGNVSVGGRVFQAGYREIILNDPDDGAGGLPGRVGALESSIEQLDIETEAATQALDALQLPDYAALRAYKGPRKSVYVTGVLGTAAPSGIAGMFVRDDADTASADNGGTVIVVGGKRFKRACDAVTPEMFGAKGDGVTDDTAALNAWAAAIVSQKMHGQCRPVTYRVTQAGLGVKFIGLRNTVIDFNGAVFKTLDGDAVSGGQAGFTFRDCQDCDFYGFTYDANRAARTPAEKFSHNINIADANQRIRFWNCRAINGVCDPWYISPETPADLSKYPTDVHLYNCEGLNGFRNNLSLIGSVRFRVYGGRFNGANGTLPQCGYDVEPDAVTIHGNINPEFHNVETSDNLGYGRQYGGPSSVVIENPNGVEFSPRGSNNAQGFMYLVRAKGLRVVNADVGPHSTLTRGAIDVASGAVDVLVESSRFRDIAATGGATCCIYVHALAVGTRITDVRAKNIACTALNLNAQTVTQGVIVEGSTAGSVIGINGAAAGYSEMSNVYIKTCASRALYMASPNCTIANFTVIDCALATGAGVIDFDAPSAGSILRGAKVVQTGGSVPAGQVAVRALCAMSEISGVSAIGGYTSANTVTGTASLFATTKVANIFPDSFAKAFTYDPPSIAAAAGVTTTTTLANANLGDACNVHAPYDLQGVIATASVSSAGNVRLSLLNPTGAAIDLASGTWAISLKKS